MPQPKDKDWLDGYKTRPLYMLSTRDPPQNKEHIQTESEGLEKDISCKWRPKKAGVAILISDKRGFEHPVSCIKPGLVICFTYDNIHVSMLFSQIIPPSPSPTESKRLFYTSVETAQFKQCNDSTIGCPGLTS